MHSDLPKALHLLAGKPLLQYVLDASRQLSPDQVRVVYGHGGELVRKAFADSDCCWIEQPRQLGTGHAVLLALEDIPDDARVLVLYGDVPLINPETLRRLVDQGAELGVLTADVEDPGGYGRIQRDGAGHMTGIVEHGDATEAERAIREINTGIMTGRAGLLKTLLSEVDNGNAQGEIYLTDVVALANRRDIHIDSLAAATELEITGINDKIQLARMEREQQTRIAQSLMEQGVTLHDPARLDVRGELVCGRNVVIDVNCVVEGRVELKDGVQVGPNVCLKDCLIGEGTIIKANSIVEETTTGANVIIGPFARLRPGTRLASEVHIGNFVEIKKSSVGVASKINHLSYVGDSQVGERVNIGAGTITCNYDGVNKHQTTIGNDVFIGSGTELVAPIEVGDGATIGAGSTVSKNVPPGQLTVERSQQKSIAGWKRPKKH